MSAYGRFAGDADYEKAVAREHVKAMFAREILMLRTEHGLTQRQHAELVGIRQFAISRLKDANHYRHSLRMLERIAEAMQCRVEVRLVMEQDFAIVALEATTNESVTNAA